MDKMREIETFWSSRPCNIKHSPVTVDEDPQLFHLSVTRRKLLVEPHIWTFCEFEKWRGKRVLDLGCGIGTQAILFAQHGAIVHGVDISYESVRIAVKRSNILGFDPVTPLFWVANIEKVGSWSDINVEYDLVHCWGVLHHTPHPELVLQGLHRWLKPTSELRLMLYNRYSWKALHILAKYGKMELWKWVELVQRYSEAQEGSPWTTTWTPRLVGKLLTQTGYRVNSMRVDHIFPYRIPEYKQGHYQLEWQWHLIGPRIFRWLEKRIGWHLMVCATPTV